MLNVSGCGSHWHKPPLTEMAICDNFDIHYHIANHNHHKLATTIRKALKMDGALGETMQGRLPPLRELQAIYPRGQRNSQEAEGQASEAKSEEKP